MRLANAVQSIFIDGDAISFLERTRKPFWQEQMELSQSTDSSNKENVSPGLGKYSYRA
jgi:hypothetical protein